MSAPPAPKGVRRVSLANATGQQGQATAAFPDKWNGSYCEVRLPLRCSLWLLAANGSAPPCARVRCGAEELQRWLYIGGAAAGGFLLLQCALLAWCCCWRARKGRTGGWRSRTKSRNSDLDISPGEPRPCASALVSTRRLDP